MDHTTTPGEARSTVPEFLAGGGEMGKLIREHDWSKTSLGPIESWPQSLRTCIRIMLTSRQPIWIGWGKELIKFYNDPYKAIVGGKHPWALGMPASIVWKDIWKDIEPMLEKVMDQDEGTYVESQLLIMERNGYPEETYYTFSYTPIPGDNGKTEGMFCANTDDTDKIISERQLTTLTQLGKHLADCKTATEIIQRTIDTFNSNPYDFPFALFRTLQENKALLTHSTPLGDWTGKVPLTVDLNAKEPIAAMMQQAVTSRKPQIFHDLVEKVGKLPRGAWEASPDKAIILPIVQTGGKDPYGVLVVGLNPYRLLDEKYSSFFSLVADQIATSFADVHALEEERKRAEALAEIDRVKTTFFSNISHEFRTPLTLLLGPIEDALSDPEAIEENKSRLEVAHRNALRMQKLVNTLLEFSRIEAGRLEGKFTRVDISAFTRDLASTFRSAIERAGMKLLFDTDDIKEEVYVDIDMWEKVILNLVSNAFKYSKAGSITIGVKQSGQKVQVSVSDTGIGIPEEHLEKIFSRFHRVENMEGRSQEGTGIGLAMVKELVRLHHGTIEVSSEVGKGSRFTITLPTGKDHIASDKIMDGSSVASSMHSAAFVQEAMKWLPLDERIAANGGGRPGNPEAGNVGEATGLDRNTVLLADDNADMRDYVHRLLANQFRVITAVDGEDAYQKLLEYRPDLVISDIMMPKLDGFGLLQKIRKHPEIKSTPVIFLSARAGEESKVEGLDAGADDYLVKPFSAKELIVRVTNHVRINQVRRETEQQFYQLFLQAPAIINVFKGPEHRYEFFHPKNKELLGNVDFTGLTIREALPALDGQGIFELLDEVYQKGKTIQQNERYVRFHNQDGALIERYFNFIYQPWYDIKGQILGILNFAMDVTENVISRKLIEESENRFRNLIMQAPVSIVVLTGRDMVVDIVNDNYLQLVDRKRESFVGRSVWDGLPEVKTQGFNELLQGVMDSGVPFTGYDQEVVLNRNGKEETIYVNFIYSPLKDVNGVPMGVMAVATEVTPQVMARKKIEESEMALNEMANAMPQLVWVSESNGEVTYFNNRLSEFKGTTKLSNGNWSWEGLIHPDDLDMSSALWREAVAKGDTFQYEHRIQMSDGSYRWHLSRGIPQKDKQGEVIKWFGTTTDIHLAKQQATILEEEVKKRTIELRELNISLQKSNEDLQQFAHVASHDLKEPVRKIKTYSNRLEDEYGALLPERGRVFLQKVQNATDRMLTMIDGVLNYSKVESNRESIETIDLNETFTQIEADLEVLIQQKGAVIKKDNLPRVEGAPVLIYQLFYNLINNSLKFTTEDVNPIIQVASSVLSESHHEMAKIIISDNGIGFSQEHAGRIFNTFSRLNSKDKYEGTGLGLSLCKKIVERHHGSISASSQKGQGARFAIILPIKQDTINI